MSTTQTLIGPDMYAVIRERDAALDALARQAVGVTVCIPYHGEGYDTLHRAVMSVQAQTVQPHEIIVVDDGFTMEDDAGRSLDTEGVLVYHVTNRGLPAARNTGLMLARGGMFLPLDADDWIEPAYIEKTLPKLYAGADVVLVGLQEHGPTRNGTYMPGYDRPHDQVTEETLWEYNRFFYCSLFRTELLREVGGYNPRMAGWVGHVSGGYEDWDLWIDLMRRGASFAAVNEVLFHYTTKPDGMLVAAEQNRGALVGEMRRHHRMS